MIIWNLISEIKFSVSPLLYDNLNINYFGEGILNSKPCISYEALISYYQHLNKGIGFNIGIGLTLAPFNFHFDTKVQPNSIFQTGKYKYDEFDTSNSEYMQSLLVFPVSLQKVFPLTKSTKYYFSAEVGAKLNVIWAYPYEIQYESEAWVNDTTLINLFKLNLYNTKNKVLLGFFAKFGILSQTKKLNTVNCNLILHYSPFKSALGMYSFTDMGFISYGTISQNINFIGLEFTFGRTLSKRIKTK